LRSTCLSPISTRGEELSSFRSIGLDEHGQLPCFAAKDGKAPPGGFHRSAAEADALFRFGLDSVSRRLVVLLLLGALIERLLDTIGACNPA
jgi:hypothetical protein